VQRHGAIFGGLAMALFVSGGLPSRAFAETLDLNCLNADGSQSYHVAIDLGSGLVSNGAGYNARRWAAVVSDKEVAWDEVFDARVGHTAHHYVLERASGVLRGTDTAGGGQGREILNLVGHKTS
jgi:hypothetical protein